MEQNKYIYIKETGQVAGPLQMTKPIEINWWGGVNDSDMQHYHFELSQWENHLKSLPRIDIVGEHSFLDGQILEDRKDILLATRSSCEIEAAIPIKDRQPAMPPTSVSVTPESKIEDMLALHYGYEELADEDARLDFIEKYKIELDAMHEWADAYSHMLTKHLRQDIKDLTIQNNSLQDYCRELEQKVEQLTKRCNQESQRVVQAEQRARDWQEQYHNYTKKLM